MPQSITEHFGTYRIVCNVALQEAEWRALTSAQATDCAKIYGVGSKLIMAGSTLDAVASI